MIHAVCHGRRSKSTFPPVKITATRRPAKRSRCASTAASAPGDAAAGKTIFQANCTGCHAGLGTQAGGVGPKLQGMGLTLDAVNHQITNGGGPMPGGLVSGKDQADVARNQRQLRHQVELLHIVLRMQRCCSQSRWIRCGSCCGLQQMAFAAAALAP